MKLNKKQFKQWMEALRSGKFEQTNAVLQDNVGYCCLGVACKILIDPKKLYKEDGKIYGGLPNQHYNAPKWLQEIDEDFKERTKDINDYYGNSGSKFITNLNDDLKLSFEEIADVLEAVYLHKAID
jgi:hypothetical protein